MAVAVLCGSDYEVVPRRLRGGAAAVARWCGLIGSGSDNVPLILH